MTNAGAIILGLLLISGAYYGYIGYHENYETCKSGLGQLGRLISSDVRSQCEQNNLYTTGSIAVGIIGAIFLLGGLVSGGKQRILVVEKEPKKDVEYTPRKRTINQSKFKEEETVKVEEEINYCSQCGTKVSLDDKFCKSCGGKLE